MKLLKFWVLMLFGLLVAGASWAKGGIDTIAARDLPAEAQQTLVLIKQGRPLPYAKDGVVFKNYEGILPRQRRGYYREYTVKTPGVRHRGARRIVVGGEQSQAQEYFYTDDHYVSFKRIRE